jgi:hypothetical protein
MEVAGLAGFDQDRMETVGLHLLADLLQDVAGRGGVGVESEDVPPDFDGERTTSSDRLLQRHPSSVSVLGVDEEGVGTRGGDREREGQDKRLMLSAFDLFLAAGMGCPHCRE